MKKWRKILMCKSRAQVLNEFVIIAAVVVVFCIAAIMTFGDSISSMVADNPFKNMYGSAKEEKVVAKQAGTDAASIRQNLKSGFVSTSGGEALLLSEVEIASLKVDAVGKIVDVKASVALSAPQKKSVTNVIYVYIDTLDHASYVIRVKKKLSKATQYSLLKNINIAAKNVDIAYNSAYKVAYKKYMRGTYPSTDQNQPLSTYDPYQKLQDTKEKMEKLDNVGKYVESKIEERTNIIKSKTSAPYWSAAENPDILVYVRDVDINGALSAILNKFGGGVCTGISCGDIQVQRIDRTVSGISNAVNNTCTVTHDCETDGHDESASIKYTLANNIVITLSVIDAGLAKMYGSINYKQYNNNGDQIKSAYVESDSQGLSIDDKWNRKFDNWTMDKPFFDCNLAPFGKNRIWFLQ